jgi:hypothetical protein
MIENDTGYIRAKKQDRENMKTITTDGSTEGGNMGWEYM